MSLVKCKECGRDISSDAPSCPGCGFRFSNPSVFNVTIKDVVLTLLFVIAAALFIPSFLKGLLGLD